MIEGKGCFEDFERAVYDEIQRRHLYDIPRRPLKLEDAPPQAWRTPREVTGIDVSRWLAAELRRVSNKNTNRIETDYVDKARTTRWFGLVVNAVDTLDGMQAKLTPDE